MMSKKASMELGISTVVVLVIAMVIIAGGIAFIRGFFNKGTESLGGAFEIADFGVEPTSMDPLVLVEGSPSIKAGDRELIRVAFYNTASSSKNLTIAIAGCVATVTTQGCSAPTMTSAYQEVGSGDMAPFPTFVTAGCTTASGKTNLPTGEYICTLVAKTATETLASKQITMTIEN